MLANPRAGLFRGAYSESPSTATASIAAFAPAFLGPLAAVFFAAFTGPLGLGNNHSLDGNTTRAAGPAHAGDQQPGGYRGGRPWDAPGRGRSTRVSPETVRPAHNLLAELWEGNPAG